MSLDEQMKEEEFDRALVNSLRTDVVPRLGNSRVPDDVIVLLGKTLRTASRLHDLDMKRWSGSIISDVSSDDSESNGSQSVEFSYWDASTADTLVGTTTTGNPLPRERFSYWCFDLLIQFCSGSTAGQCPTAFGSTSLD